MKGLKIFLVILFVIGLLFIVGTTLGSTHSDDQGTNAPGWLTNIEARLVISQPLKMADFKSPPANCVQQNYLLVAVGTTCQFAIKESSFIQRVATVRLLQGTSVVITLAQEKVLPIQETLTATGAVTDNRLKMYPGKAQGVLEIQCLQSGKAPACQLQLT